MRSIWSGAISFGLVNIPIKLYSAAGENKLDFDMLAKDDHSPIKYKKVAVSDGREVNFKDIVKGYEYEKGQYVILDDEDFEKAQAKKTKAIDILGFVMEEEIDPVFYDKPYFLEPDKNAAKPYALLREALRETKKVGIAKYVLRNREHLAALKPVGNVILLNQMRYYRDIRDYNELSLPSAEIITDPEKEMAKMLIDQLSQDFQPEKYRDTYIQELKEIIEAKAKGQPVEAKGAAPEPTRVDDLMATLKASLAAGNSKSERQRGAVKREKKKSTTKAKK